MRNRHGKTANTLSNRPLGSTMFAPGVPLVEKTFHFTDSNLATSIVSIYVLEFAVGPLFIAPLSETYGRQPVYIISMIVFVFCQLACALSTNVGMLLAFRFLAGCAGSTPATIGAATIGDMFPRENRAGAMTVWGIGAQLGPILGPVIGGFLSQAKGWRWVFWLLTIISGAALLLGTIFLRETYSVVILERKTQRMIRETGNQSLVSALYDPTPPREVYKRTIIRPVKMLIFSPIVLLLSIYLSVVFGYFYLFLTTFTRVFQEQYGFGIGIYRPDVLRAWIRLYCRLDHRGQIERCLLSAADRQESWFFEARISTASTVSHQSLGNCCILLVWMVCRGEDTLDCSYPRHHVVRYGNDARLCEFFTYPHLQ